MPSVEELETMFLDREAIWAFGRVVGGKRIRQEDAVMLSMAGLLRMRDGRFTVTDKGRSFARANFPHYFDGRCFPRVRRFLHDLGGWLQSV